MLNRTTATTDRKQSFGSRPNTKRAPFIGTFHALGAKILREEARRLGRTPNFAIFDDHDSFDIVKRLLKNPAKKKLEKIGTRGEREKTEKEKPAFFAQKISALKNKPELEDILRGSGRAEDKKVMEVFEKYERALEENNAFDFDDLIRKPVEIFKTLPETLAKHAGRFDAIFVDEFQDINPMQYELVKFLGGEHRNVSVVGDDEQLIYGWRYADLKIFSGFEKDWPGARIAFLEENYRSMGNIIQAASAVASHNQYRRPKNLWTKNQPGAQIKLAEVAHDEEEAEFIANAIKTTTTNNNYDRKKTTTDTKDDDRSLVSGQLSAVDSPIAVLYRTNAQSRAIEQALIRHQIPYKIFGGIKFYERKEIKDIVAAMRYFTNKKDSLSKERLEKNLTRRAFSGIEAALIAAKKETAPAKLVEIFIKATDYFDYLERSFTNYAEREENVAELLRFASRFDSLQPFLEEIALVQATDMPINQRLTSDKLTLDHNKSNQKDRGSRVNGRLSNVRGQMSVVHLSTIHLAKGLEFDRVFIAGCSEGLLPHERSMDNEYSLEEERRLMYVAMTRAKKELAISFYGMPSRFISEIPQELLLYSAPQDRETHSETGEKYVYLDE